MGPGEILHRLQSLAWMTCHRNVAPLSVRLQPPKPWDLARPPVNDPARLRLLEEADSYLDHRWFFFGLDGVQEAEIDWQRDPASGKATLLKFSPRIDFRDPLAVGSIKNIWEKNRHHHLTILAEAYALTGAERYALEATDQILQWINDNPFLIGANWISPMECGIRLISWVWCERLLRTSSNYESVFGPEGPFWRSVYQHQAFIDHAFARGSSANNHVIGEMAGQFIVSAAWPFFPKSQAWRDRAAAILEEEIVKQTFPSGLNREQAFGYHLFVAEFFMIALYEAKQVGHEFSDQYKQLLRRMIEIVPHLTDVGGNLPRYGDGDDGMAVQLQALRDRRDTWLFDFGRLLLDADVPSVGEPSLSARIAGYERIPAKEILPPTGNKSFEDAGLYVFASERGTPKEIFVLFDAGPQGYLSQAAHGHADALSFTLSVGGNPVLVDPGTYCYHAESDWRAYFRGTHAHNTVMVDGQDQAVSSGVFLWSKKADAKVVSRDLEQSTIIAEHDGYRHHRIGVIHQRKIVLQDNILTLTDELRGIGEHQLEWRFHFASDCEAVLSGGVCDVVWPGGKTRLRLDPTIDWTLAKGCVESGWLSPSFGVRKETFTLCGRLKKALPVSVMAAFEICV